MSNRRIKPRIAYAAVYPEQGRITLAGTYDTARDAWGDCLDQFRYRQETWQPLITNATLKRAGFRVIKVRIAADE